MDDWSIKLIKDYALTIAIIKNLLTAIKLMRNIT